MLVLYTARASAFSTDNALKVWMDQKVELTADGKTVTKLTVYECDPDVDYISFNMALFVPKGTQIYKYRSGRKEITDIALNEDRNNGHTILCNMPDDHTIKIIAYSGENNALFHDTYDGVPVEELFTIGLICDNSTINGTYHVEMLDVNFTYRDKDSKITSNGIDHIEYSDFTVTGGQDFPGIDYTMTSAGYGTLMLPFNCEIPKGLTAFECSGVDSDNMLMLNSVNSFAANTPYIVKGSPATYHFNGVYSALFDEYSTKYMTGVYADKKVPVDSYVLQNQEDYGLAFYRVYESPEVTMPPYRCWINKQSDNTAKCMKLPDTITGVSSVVTDKNNKVDVYTTSGVRVRSNVDADKALDSLPAGVYIVNNNKVVKK